MAIIDEMQAFAELAAQANNLALSRKALDLYAQVVKLEGENVELAKRVAGLQARLDLKHMVNVEEKTHTLIVEGEPGRYCVTCYEEGKLRRLQKKFTTNEKYYHWSCNKCRWDSSWFDSASGTRVHPVIEL